jgi:hypothetical protein
MDAGQGQGLVAGGLGGPLAQAVALPHPYLGAAEQEGPLRERFEALAGPQRARLKIELPEAKRNLADLQGRHNAYGRFQYEHPEALRRLERLDEQIATAAWELDVERQGLDGIRPEPPESSAQRWAAERGIRGMDRSMDLGIDL